MIIIDSIKKTVLLAGGLFLFGLSINADDVQDKLNFFKSPEAAAFMKYGEESVNEYTGTANISIPLYTVKCKDIEIPLVLNYNASGIKVDQEASWVGLGWDLTVGGCVNYVSAGSKDMINATKIEDDSWTQYLSTATKNYDYSKTVTSNWDWMSRIPYENSFVGPYNDNVNDGWGVKQYLDSGYGERDFYSVNVLGKSFMFFIDPHTLNVYKIGQAGEEYKVELEYEFGSIKPGLGRQSDIIEWKITDANGFVYFFKERDIIRETYPSQTEYTSCWYLTEIKSSLGETVTLSYEKCSRQSRPQRIESLNIPIIKEQTVGQNDKTYKINESDFPSGSNNTPKFVYAPVTHSYVNMIKTRNQTITFNTSECEENSGRRLNSIVVLSCNNDVVKNYVFSYGKFGCSGIGGNEGISDKTKPDFRLKLDNVKEIASGETHTTSFSYYSTDLPSQMSCARDYWGYYNGQQNKRDNSGRYTLIPAPQEFMSRNYKPELSKRFVGVKYADRFSRDDYMQVGILNRIDYPTGGYTTYEYEANRIPVKKLEETQKFKVGGISKYEVGFCCSKVGSSYEFEASKQILYFCLERTQIFDIYLECQSDVNIDGKKFNLQINGKNTPLTFKSSNGHVFIQSLTLSPGSYKIVLTPPNVTKTQYSANCQLRWYDLSESDYYILCGGLRIKKISNYDNDNSLIGYIDYNYNDSEGSSTGILLNNIETIDVHDYKMFKTTTSPIANDITQRYDYAIADVYSITPGKSRMSEFYATYNPGIVGYSQVIKRKYSSEGKIEKYIVTKYKNTAPKNSVVDYYKYDDCYNGRVLCQDVLDADSNLILRTNNTYNIKLENHYAINMWHDHETILGSSTGASYSGANIPTTKIWRYPYILSRIELVSDTTKEYCQDGKNILRTKKYFYNPNNHQVSQIDENTSLCGQIKRTKFRYSVDEVDNISCKAMVQSYHKLNDIVQTKNTLVENGQEKCLSTKYVTYIPNGLPESTSTSIGDYPLEKREEYIYDGMSNVRSVKLDGVETVYIWSYNGQYPIAKIEGVTLNDVIETMAETKRSQYSVQASVTDIGNNALSEIMGEKDPDKILGYINTIREKIAKIGGHVSTYTYKSLIGITSQTLPNGLKTTYEYDGFGRLIKVLDHNGKVISTNEYNYKK